METLKIAGIGEIIFDHHFIEGDDQTIFNSSRGGGTVWNVIANLASEGLDCSAIGVYGELSPYGKIAKDEMTALGIETKHLVGIKNKQSRVIFENFQNKTLNQNKHTFSDKCIICGKRPDDSKIARLKTFDFVETIYKEKINVIILDRLTKDRVEIVKKVKSIMPNVVSIIDVGRISYLRYVPTPQIISYLSEFDIIFINNDEALNPLLRRLGTSRKEEYLQSFLQKSKTKYIVSTKGKYGYDLIFKGDFFTEPSKYKNVYDTAGAGDAFMAYFIKNAITNIFDKETVINALKASSSSLENVLNSIGARGHINLKNKINSPVEKYLFKDVKSIQKDTKSDLCPFCFVEGNEENIIGKEKSIKPSISKTIADLSNRLLFTFERKSAIEQCKDLLKIGGTIHVVGTGGSYISAFFISQVINEMGKSFALPIRPFDYVNSVHKKSNALIILTYSGSTSDYEPVIKRATKLGVEQIFLITHSKKPKLLNLFTGQNTLFESNLTKGSFINYSAENSQKERGFISIAGTLLPSFLFLLAGLGDAINEIDFHTLIEEKRNKTYENIKGITQSIKESQAIEVYGGGMSWTAMLDLESKLIEGGICAVQLHEFKDFSHGRFMFSLKNKLPKIVFQVDEDPYIERLIQILTEYKIDIPVLVIKSSKKGLIGNIELLIEVQYFVHKLADEIDAKTDITKPKDIPTLGLELYRWRFN